MCEVCMQAYDLVAGTQGLTMSRFNTREESHRQFPTLAQTRSEDGSSLKGTVSVNIQHVHVLCCKKTTAYDDGMRCMLWACL